MEENHAHCEVGRNRGCDYTRIRKEVGVVTGQIVGEEERNLCERDLRKSERCSLALTIWEQMSATKNEVNPLEKRKKNKRV